MRLDFTHQWRLWAILTIAAVGILVSLLLPAIPQDPTYHQFADRRSVSGIPNFWNVVTNLPFVLVGLWSITKVSQVPAPRTSFVVLCLGLVLVGAGSTYYHLAPSTPTLTWDRLPMTIVFTVLFALVLEDRITKRGGHVLLWLLIAIGAASVGYWHVTELQGKGDLRLYGLVQFLPLVLIPLIVVLYPKGATRRSFLWGMFIAYVCAKLAEHYDREIFEMTGIISGHSIKHLLAAGASVCFVLAFCPGSAGRNLAQTT